MTIAELSKPFPPSAISWRVGSTTKDKSKGLALAYIDSRDVMDLLDRVIGPENWQCSYPHADKKTICEISIFVNGQWVSKADGAGDSDVEAEKGAISDAFKRAAVKWGIGRYLYDVKNVWVELEPKGNSHVIKQSEYKRLESVLNNISNNTATVISRITEERKAFIIKTMVEAKAPEVMTKLQSDAKEECVKINDATSYAEIVKEVTKQRKEAKEVK